MTKRSARAFAPATTGNVGVGFDILGLALDAVGDTVTVEKTKQKGKVEITQIAELTLPMEPENNTATAGLVHLLRDFDCDFGFKVKIKKGIPLGSGLGGSAASAVAGTVAGNALLPKPLKKPDLMKYALIGEAVATGTAHGDNVAPCLFGGLVLIQSTEPLKWVSVPLPSGLVIVVTSPNHRVDTKDARQVLKSDVPLKDFVKQSAKLAGFIAGCFERDIGIIRDSLEDLIIEPQRAKLIPGFYDVKNAALKEGALGCTISGAGPAVFALAEKKNALKVKKAMTKAFESAGLAPVKAWISPLNKKGAYLL